MNKIDNKPMVNTVINCRRQTGMTTEISMAGNLRESGITFNAAEAGLRVAEEFVDNEFSSTAFASPATGLYPAIDNDPSYGVSATWDASQTASVTLPHVIEPPRFIVKYLGDRSQNEVAAVNIGGYGSGQPGITVSNFRITARGVGQSGNAQRIVQSYFGKEF